MAISNTDPLSKEQYNRQCIMMAAVRDTVRAVRIMINHGRLRLMLEPRGDRRYLARSTAQEW